MTLDPPTQSEAAPERGAGLAPLSGAGSSQATIKVIRFYDESPDDFVQPGSLRASLGLPIDDPDLPPPPFAAVGIQWFDDVDAAVTAANGSTTVVAEEVVLRGADYLASRWAGGGERLKMMSFGRRNPRWTRQEFSQRWRRDAGRVGGDAIPEDVRGLAYVQNHPLLTRDDPPFDAVNEVWFERLDLLRRRGAYIAAMLATPSPSPADSLMAPGAAWSMFVRETPL